MQEVRRVLKKRSFITYEKLQSLIGLFFLAAKVVYSGQIFLRRNDETLAKSKKYL